MLLVCFLKSVTDFEGWNASNRTRTSNLETEIRMMLFSKLVVVSGASQNPKTLIISSGNLATAKSYLFRDTLTRCKNKSVRPSVADSPLPTQRRSELKVLDHFARLTPSLNENCSRIWSWPYHHLAICGNGFSGVLYYDPDFHGKTLVTVARRIESNSLHTLGIYPWTFRSL